MNVAARACVHFTMKDGFYKIRTLRKAAKKRPHADVRPLGNLPRGCITPFVVNSSRAAATMASILR